MSDLQFPKNPVVGQQYDFTPYKYYWDGAKWKTMGIGYNPVNDLRNEVEPRISSNESRISSNESKVFEALKRSYADAGFNLVEGSFEEGGVLSVASDVMITASGDGYSWTGAFPKVVAPGTDPAAVAGFVMRTDAGLRGELAAVGSDVLISGLKAGVVAGAADAFSAALAQPGSTVSIAGLDAGKVKTAADNVRAVTLNTGSGTQSVSATQIGSSILFTSATTVVMPTTESLGGVTGHYRIIAGANPITLTRSDGLLFTVRGATVASVTIPAGSDCYVAYDASGVYVYGLATYETIVKSYCLVNALGTGAPNELVSAALPANIANNTRYVLANPFGINVPVTGWAEIFYNGVWSQTGFIYSSEGYIGYGVAFNYVQGSGIVIQTGSATLLASKSSYTGSGHGITTAPTITSAPCRVFIQKLGV